MKTLIALLLLALPLQAEVRTWTSTEGKTFAGELKSSTDTTAKLRRSDGRVFDITLDKLSDADKKYIADFQAAQKKPAKTIKDSPFADKLDDKWVKLPKDDFGLIYQIYGSSKLSRSKEPIPLFVHLHGAGARADDVEAGKVEIAPERLASEEFYKKHPCIIIAPLCPPDTSWGDHVGKLEKIIDNLIDSLPIDTHRIYLSGYSMGSRGVGSLLESRPKFYAAALFADGEAKMKWVDTVDTALWLTYSGERDFAAAEAVAKAYSAAGKIAHFEAHPSHTHNQIHWTLAKTKGVYEWTFSQVRN
jgi:predicted peptidase